MPRSVNLHFSLLTSLSTDFVPTASQNQVNNLIHICRTHFYTLLIFFTFCLFIVGINRFLASHSM